MNSSPRKSSLLIIFLTVFIDLLGFGIVLPLLPLYARQFSLDKTGWKLGALMASFSLMQFIFAPMWGRLSDRIGRRPVILVGLAGSVVFYGLFAVATAYQSLAMLFVSRLGAGIAGATIPTAQAYIADTTAASHRAKGMALIGMAFGLGFTLGPLVGAISITNSTGQPGIGPGVAAAGLSFVALLLAWFLLVEPSTDKTRDDEWTLFDLHAFRRALSIPSLGALLGSFFLTVFAFANFEVTLSLLIKQHDDGTTSFGFSEQQVFFTFAYIGLVLALVQGGIVRRVAGKVPELRLATTGLVLEMIGFVVLLLAVKSTSIPLLFVALALVVSGFGFLSPSINSLISRRTPPEQQGEVLGVGQGMSGLARILGSSVGIPLLMAHPTAPFVAGLSVMLISLFVLRFVAHHGGDYVAQPK